MRSSLALVAVVAFATSGCHCQPVAPPPAKAAPRTPMVAVRTSAPIKLDGRLDEEAWKSARPVPLKLPLSTVAEGRTIEEPGTVRMLHDGETLWLGFEFEDSDVVGNAKADDEELYTLGDVAEIFLRPVGQTGYWEIHMAPNQRSSTYWYPGRGRLGLRGEDPHLRPPFWSGAAVVEGTLNDWRDRDRRWTAEVALPIAKLRRPGDPDPIEGGWTILVARYNYTRYRVQATGPELSSSPALARPNYHLIEDYSPLKFAP